MVTAGEVLAREWSLSHVDIGFFLFLWGGCLFRATPATYGDSQARGRTGAVAARLHHRHSDVWSEPSLRPTPQLMATLDP